MVLGRSVLWWVVAVCVVAPLLDPATGGVHGSPVRALSPSSGVDEVVQDFHNTWTRLLDLESNTKPPEEITPIANAKHSIQHAKHNANKSRKRLEGQAQGVAQHHSQAARERMAKAQREAQRFQKLVTNHAQHIDPAPVFQSMGTGASGAVLAGVVAEAGMGSGFNPLVSAIAGMASGAVANARAQLQPPNADETGSNTAVVGAGVGALVGAGTHLLLNGGPGSEAGIVAPVLGGAVAGFIGHGLGEGKGSKGADGDMQLSYEEIRAALGGGDELNLQEVMEYTRLSEVAAADFMERVGTEDGRPPKEGGTVSVMEICMFLDQDDSGAIDEAELAAGMFDGDSQLAREFVISNDSSKPADDTTAIFRGDDIVSKQQFFSYMQKFANDDGRCEELDHCEIDQVTLSLATDLRGGRPALDETQARRLIKSIRKSLREQGSLRQTTSSEPALPSVQFEDLFRFLVCGDACSDEAYAKRDEVTKTHLVGLTSNKVDAKRLAMAVLEAQDAHLSEEEKELSKLRRRFNASTPMEALRIKAATKLYGKSVPGRVVPTTYSGRHVDAEGNEM